MPSPDAAALLTHPTAAFDAAWAADVRRRSPAERVRWLDAADAATRVSLAARRNAVEVYRALADDVADDLGRDDARADARLRLLWEKDGRRDAIVARLAARATASRDPALAALAEVVAAECVAEAQDHERAEELLVALLARHRGAGTDVELRCASSLAEVYRRQGRDYETLILARRTLALAEARDRADFRAMAAFRLVETLAELDEWEAHAPALALFAAAMAQVGERAGEPLWFVLWAHRAEVAVREGDVEAADRAGAELEARSRRAPIGGRAHEWVPSLLTRVELAAGRLDAARARLDAIAADRARRTDDALLSEFLWARAARRPDVERTVATELLARLEQPPAGTRAAGRVLRATRELVAHFAAPPADPDALRRAYDVAGAAILERMAQLDRALRMVPELSVAEPEDRRTLDRSRARFQVEQAAVLDGVASVLARRLGGPRAPLPDFDRDGRYLRVCAWCRRVAMANGTWLPVGHYLPSRLPSRGGLHLSHGICPDCIPTIVLPPALV